MKELEEYRTSLVQRLEESAKAFHEACIAAQDPHAPLEPGGWNVHQIAVHTRDVENLVYGLRVRATAQEDDPEFSNFDGEAYMAGHYDPQESLNELLRDFVQSVESLVAFLRALPPQDWSRVSRHTTLGRGLTLQSWVEKGLAHIREHLAEVQQSKIRSEFTK